MELNDFVKNFAEQFDDTDASEINASTSFHDLDEWSSLVGMSVIAMVKTQYNKTLTGSEIKNSKTVEQLYNLISSKE